MLTCRRFIAFLMIVLFLPGADLAGVPLQWCLGNDGHRIVEPVATAHQHSGHASVQKVAAERHILPASTLLRSHGHECRDVLIGTEAVSSTRNNSELKHKLASDRPDTTLDSAAGESPSYCIFDQAPCGTGRAVAAHRDPRLVSLATIVLLI